MAKSKKKLVFISFSSADNDKVEILADLLKKSKTLAPLVVVRNRRSMENLDIKIIDSIKECEFFVPILTSKSYLTQWINQEIGYAKAIKSKDNIVPIVEKSIIGDLRGFIHDQIDLPDTFTNEDSNANFTDTCKKLIKHLNSQSNKNSVSLSIGDFFKGTWINMFTHPVNGEGREMFHISDGNKYIIKGQHIFDVEKVKLSSKGDRLQFTKVRVSDGSKAKNDLLRMSDGSWEGAEDKFNPVHYKPFPSRSG